MSIAGRRWRRTSLLVAGAGLFWLLLLTLLGAHKASGFAATYGYLEPGAAKSVPATFGLVQVVDGIAKHPVEVVRTLWDRRLNLYSNIAPGGLVGVLSPWAVVPTMFVLMENGLSHNLGFLSTARFQDIVAFLLVPVGTVAILAWLAKRHRKTALVLMGLIAADTIAWAIVWLPHTATQWIRTSAAASSTLASIEGRIPASDQVVASQGIAGPFSGRRWISTIIGPATFNIHTQDVWVIVAPSQGVELASVAVSDGAIAQLAGPLRATLVTQANGIWAFRWTPPPGVHTLVVPAAEPTVEAWTSVGSAGAVTTTGPSSTWRAVANGRRGYVVAGDYWRELSGRYQATTVVAATLPVDVEVWNATSDELLARRSVPATNGYVAVTMPVALSGLAPAKLYAGVSPFTVDPVPPPPGNQLEIRVWTPGGGSVSVASLELVPAR